MVLTSTVNIRYKILSLRDFLFLKKIKAVSKIVYFKCALTQRVFIGTLFPNVTKLLLRLIISYFFHFWRFLDTMTIPNGFPCRNLGEKKEKQGNNGASKCKVLASSCKYPLASVIANWMAANNNDNNHEYRYIFNLLWYSYLITAGLAAYFFYNSLQRLNVVLESGFDSIQKFVSGNVTGSIRLATS